jgi:hypothetical protein
MIIESIDYEKLKQYVDAKLHVEGQNTRSLMSIKRAIAEYLHDNKLIEIRNKDDGMVVVWGKEHGQILTKTLTMYCDLYADTCTMECGSNCTVSALSYGDKPYIRFI